MISVTIYRYDRTPSCGRHRNDCSNHYQRFGSSVEREGARSTIGLWGPNARLLLQRCTDADVTDDGFGYFWAKEMYAGEVPVVALRVSYVGELGWELWTPTWRRAARNSKRNASGR